VPEDLFSPMHLLVLFAIIFFLFGAKRLPDLGKSLGHGIREFRGGIAGLSEPDSDEALPAATPAEPLAVAAPVAADEAEIVATDESEVVTADEGEIVAADEGEIVAADDIESATAGRDTQQRAAS
jgi:sec-independent protein translocase protein TatA